MKKIIVAALAAAALSAGPALAADLVTKAKPVAAPPTPEWDVAFGAAVASDYIFRGITQSNHQPSVASYFEPRYNPNKDWQFYVGLGGASISFPNRAAAEIDIYGGARATFDKLAVDVGIWYYWYPGGTCYNINVGGECAANADAITGGLPINGNFIKSNLSFYEIYGKATYTFSDQFAVMGTIYYSPSVLNSGADGIYFSGGAKYTMPAWSNGVGMYFSGEIGYWDLGTSDSFYGFYPTYPNGIPYKSYATWNLGVGWTYKVLTLDLRYIDTNLNKGDCNAFTSDQTASGPGTSVTAINPGGFSSNWCGARFVARLSADLTWNSNVK
jgi:hypothetical protein